tara:strand:- start:3523 stop:3984 length:462 start_codon:yes stop_codon:yes gene_type:complete
MINSVYFNSIEIGTVQTVEAFGNITFRAIYKKSKNGIILSKYFNNLEDAENWINHKYNLEHKTKEKKKRTTKKIQKCQIPFASALKKDISKSGFSQKEVSEFINCHLRSITAWQAGTQYPAAHFIYRICKMLGEEEAPKKLIEYMDLIEKERL